MSSGQPTNKVEGCVVSEHTTATDIGCSMYEKGGNAVDAIVACILAVETLAPYHSGIGGGGFALVRTPEGEHTALSFRGAAPAAATAQIYKDGASTQRGGAAVAVPGELRGLKALHERYGQLAWRDVVKPSVDLAREGFPFTADIHEYVNKCTEPPNSGNLAGSIFENEPFYAPLFEDGKIMPLDQGRTWSRPEYADTITTLMEEGPEPFYTGRIAESIVKVVRERGGQMTMEDLKSYDVKWLDVLEADYKGGKLYSVPAPASGAMFITGLGVLSHYKSEGDGSAADLHRTTEAIKLAFGLRTELGDPDFVTGLIDKQMKWTTPKAMEERSKMISDKTHEPDYYKGPDGSYGNLDHGTSNITAADSNGLMCTVTTTVGLPWGSGIMVPEYGFVLNDSMDDFSIEGMPNGFGYEPTPANFIKGGKRPLSSSCPYLVERDGRPILIGGAAGGSAIISANIQVARNVLDYGMSAHEAVAANRIHDQILPNRTCLEKASPPHVKGHTEENAKALEACGHKVEWLDKATSTACVVKFSYDDDQGKVDWESAGEPRKHMAGGRNYRAKA